MFATLTSDLVAHPPLAPASPSGKAEKTDHREGVFCECQPHLKESRLSENGTRLCTGWLRKHRYSPRLAETTSTQKIVLQVVACGLSDKDIAHFLGITCATVKAHNAAIMNIMGLRRRVQMVRFVFESGWFDPEAAEKALELRVRARRSRGVTAKGAA